MQYGKLLHAAWQATLRSPRLKWFAFVAALAQVGIMSMQASWQLYRYSNTFGIIEEDSYLKGLTDLGAYISSSNLTGLGIGFLLFIILFNYLLPAIFKGTILLGVRQKLQFPEQRIFLRQKVMLAGKSFFEMVELNAVGRFFTLWGTLLYGLSMYRWTIDGDLPLPWDWIKPFWIFWLILSFLSMIFLTFSEYFLLYEGTSFKESIKKSIGLVFVHLGHTVAVGLLMFLVNLRVVVNLFLVLGVPLAIGALLTLWTSQVAFGVALLLGSIMLVLVSYLNAILDVFSAAVWAKTFFYLREKQDEIQALDEA